MQYIWISALMIPVLLLSLLVELGKAGIEGNSNSWARSRGYVQFLAYPPGMVLRPESTAVEVGKHVSFFCKGDGNPLPRLTWLRNGHPIEEGSRYVVVPGLDEGISSLRIEPVRARDNNTRVTCVVNNGRGSPVRADATLTTYDTDELPAGFPRVLVNPQLKAVEKGRPGFMSCKYDGNPVPTISWLRNYLPVNIKANPRYSLATQGNPGLLRIENTTKESDEGKYECIVKNKFGTAYSKPAHMYVKVRRVPPHFSRPPKQVYEVSPGADVNLTCIAVGHPMPFVYWREGGYRDLDRDKKITGRNILTLSNVQQSKNYSCVAVSKYGNIEASTHVIVKALPKPPSGLRVTNKTAYSISLAWDTSPDPSVLRYIIQYRRKDALGQTKFVDGSDFLEPGPVTKPETTITGLEPFVLYEFRSSSVNQVGRGPPSHPLTVQTSEAKPQSAPRDVQAKPLNDRSIMVQWKEPLKANGEVERYKVWYTLSPALPFDHWNHEEVEASSTPLTTITSLKPESMYYIRVSAKNAIGYGPLSQPITVITKHGVPGQPVRLHATPIGSDRMLIRWDPPLFSGSDVLSYSIKWSSSNGVRGSKTLSSGSTEYTLKGLTPDTEYTFYVVAKSRRGDGAPSQNITVKTNPAVPTGPPRHLQEVSKTRDSIVVGWESPALEDREDAPVESFKIRWALADLDSPDVTSPTADPTTPAKAAEAGVEIIFANASNTFAIKGLKTWTKYTVWVSAGTVKGFGPEANITLHTQEDGIRAANDVPSAPCDVHVKVLNATAIRVAWKEPAEPNGVLAGYYVFAERLQSGNPLNDESIARPVTDEGVTSLTLNGLRPSSEYAIRVNAFNRKGDGEFSPSQVVNTPGQVPSRPRGVDFTFLKTTPPIQMQIEWKEPPQTFGLPVTKYRLQYRPTDTGHPRHEMIVTKNYAILDNLSAGREYELRVRAINEEGAGEDAIELIETPSAKPSAPPENIVYEYTPGEGLKFSWDPPPLEHRNGKIEKYMATIDPSGQRHAAKMDSGTGGGYLVIRPEKGEHYGIKVRACNSIGCGNWSPQVTAQPPGKTIPSPTDVQAQAMSETLVVLYWPDMDNRDVIAYKVKYKANVNADAWSEKVVEREKACGFQMSNRKYCHAKIDGLYSRRAYSFKVAAKAKGSNSKWSALATLDSIDPTFVVSDLRDVDIEEKGIAVQWAYSGPRPAQFRTSCYGSMSYWDQNNILRDIYHNQSDCGSAKVGGSRYQFVRLLPNTNYTLGVAVVTGDGREFWPAQITERTKIGLPPRVYAPVKPETVNSGQVSVLLRPSSEEYGPVTEYWLVVVPESIYAKASKKRSVTKDAAEMLSDAPFHPDKITSKELITAAEEFRSEDAYIAAILDRSDIVEGLQEGEYMKQFVIGDSVVSAKNKHIRNHPLDSKLKYRAFVRAFVGPSGNRLHKSSEFSPEFSSWSGDTGVGSTGNVKDSLMEGNSGSLWIIGPVVAALISLLIALALLILWLRRKKQPRLPNKHNQISKVQMVNADPLESSKLLMPDGYAGAAAPPTFMPPPGAIMTDDPHFLIPNGSNNSLEMKRMLPPQVGMVSSSLHPPIPISELAAHLERLKANENALFSKEYESIETGQHFTWECSNMEVNKPKNRYANVIAYDHSRVILNNLDGILGSDYINANYCDGYRREKAYIATQGPLQETFADFWRMVWEENTATIVMLTKLEERARIKCDQYWPSRGTLSYDRIVSVTLKETVELAHYTMRTFLIQRTGYTELREVRHLQFTAWPDHGVPEHPTKFLMFLKRVKSLNPTEAGPIVVHCSAGVGRSGAFLVIDIMLDRLRYENTVDVYSSVTALRAQRNYMVQTEDQYMFIHEAVLDAVQSGSTEVPVSRLYTHLQKLIQTTPLDSLSGMEMEFRHLSALQMPHASFTSANQPCNKQKNRLVNILPYDSTRVILSPSAHSEDSDYINASFVDGYRHKNAYIATQGPLPNTVDDFWRMLWEHNSTIVVMLTRLREMGRDKCHEYWPERAQQYGPFVVDPIAEYNMPQYVLREFKLTDSRDGQSRTLRHFNYIEWPEQGVPKSAEYFIDFIGQVHKTKEQFGQDGPITIHCSAGVGRTGVFIALSIILDRMRYENVVDVFTTVKLLRTERPNMIQSEDQYHFCYQAALEYLGSFDHYAC